MPPRNDESLNFLQSLAVPKASPRAIESIVAAAALAPRSAPWLKTLRRIRAYLFIPSLRFAVMAVILFFIMVLGFSKNSSPVLAPDSEREITNARPDQPSSVTAANFKLKKKQMLMDVDFSEEEWANKVWETTY